MSGISFESFNDLTAPFLFRNTDLSGRRRMWHKLATMLENRVPILEALKELRKLRIDNGQPNHPSVYALRKWIENVDSGKSLHVGLQGWVSPEEQMLIGAGEDAGDLIGSLRAARELMFAKTRVKSAIVKGLAYPLFLFVFVVIALYGFSYKMVPAFTSGNHGTHFKGLAHFAVVFSGLIHDWIFFGLGGLAALLVAYVYSLPRWTGSIRTALDSRFVPYSIYRVLHGSSFLTSVAALVGAGSTTLRSVQKLADLADGKGQGTGGGAAKFRNRWLSVRLHACIKGLNEGKNMGEALAMAGHNFPDIEVINDIGVFSKYGDFDVALAVTASDWLEEAVSNVEAKCRILFAIAIITVTVVMSIIATGLIDMESQFSANTQRVQTIPK